MGRSVVLVLLGFAVEIAIGVVGVAADALGIDPLRRRAARAEERDARQERTQAAESAGPSGRRAGVLHRRHRRRLRSLTFGVCAHWTVPAADKFTHRPRPRGRAGDSTPDGADRA
jgi:hypothetical protein